MTDVLRDILSESAEEYVFWRYTNVNSQKHQKHYSTHQQTSNFDQRTLPSSLRHGSIAELPVSQENTLKDSLGQSHSQHLATYF